MSTPAAIPVTGNFYAAECYHCGYKNSSEAFGVIFYEDDADMICPVCGSSHTGSGKKAVNAVSDELSIPENRPKHDPTRNLKVTYSAAVPEPKPVSDDVVYSVEERGLPKRPEMWFDYNSQRDVWEGEVSPSEYMDALESLLAVQGREIEDLKRQAEEYKHVAIARIEAACEKAKPGSILPVKEVDQASGMFS